jgi:hypothetical protein
MVAAPAAARSPVILPATTGSLASELTELANLVKPADDTCSDHCFLLDRMHLGGAMDKGTLDFEVTGEVLHKGSFQIPLFGPSSQVRVTDVTENGNHATIGFEDGHYYVQTSNPHFVLRGKLVLGDERALTIVGPLVALDSDVKGGRITEGAHLSALANAQIHFDAEGDAPAAQPPVFSIARAIRVGKNIEFEYRLNAQSGTDLGLLRLPLRYGERVVDVEGATNWRVESEDLVLPTNGKSATITVTGTIANVASFSPDPRAPFEWWLLESDAEHRVVATGDGKQHDLNESPIARKEPNSRLYLVTRGQHLDLTIQTLQSLDVLAATVRSHSRTLVLTSAGDLVAQDTLTYDNNGLDYLYYTPDGKPLYLATDGASERVMHKDGSDDLMIPMRIGAHVITVQSLAQTSVGTFFGRVAMPGSRVPLATGSEDITIGLPDTIHPLAVIGGERTTWPLQSSDAIALAVSALAAALAFAGWKKRSLGAVTIFGLWLVSKPLFAVALVAVGVSLLWPLAMRTSKTTRRVALALGILASIIGGAAMVSMRADKGIAATATPAAFDQQSVVDNLPAQRAQAETAKNLEQEMKADMRREDESRSGEHLAFAAQLAHGGLVDGVRPVALSMPAYSHAAYASQQLVTPSRAFSPVVYYVTDSGLALLALAWLACGAGLAWLSRDKLRALREKIRAALAPKSPEPATATSTTSAPQTA